MFVTIILTNRSLKKMLKAYIFLDIVYDIKYQSIKLMFNKLISKYKVCII